MAYARFLQRNPLPDGTAVRAGILERKRYTLSLAVRSLAAAAADGNHQAVARLVDTVTKADAELARMYGLSREQLDVNVTQTPAAIVDRMEQDLLALARSNTNIIEAEVVE